MPPKKLRRQPASLVNNSRWVAYAAAGAATAIAGVNSAEADIHYSGAVNFPVPAGEGIIHSFALDNSAKISFANFKTYYAAPGVGAAFFRLQGAAVSNMFLGAAAGNFRYPSNLASGANIPAGPFATFRNGTVPATLAYGAGFGNSKFLSAGTGFIGFRFDGGSGIEYGWARVTMNGVPGNGFTLVDYAWGDPGTAITAGETAVPEPDSLGLLALGGVGLLAWRRSRAKATAQQ